MVYPKQGEERYKSSVPLALILDGADLLQHDRLVHPLVLDALILLLDLRASKRCDIEATMSRAPDHERGSDEKKPTVGEKKQCQQRATSMAKKKDVGVWWSSRGGGHEAING